MVWISHDKSWRSNTCSTIYKFSLMPNPARDYVRGYRELKDFFGNNLRISCLGWGGTNLSNLWHVFPCLVTTACDICFGSPEMSSQGPSEF